MKFLSISTALTALILTSTTFAAQSKIPELKIINSTELSETLVYNDSTLIRSKKSFETREEAQNFCKSQGAKLAASIDILVAIILNNDREGNEIHAGLNDTASYLVVHAASGGQATGTISWLSDDELSEGAAAMGADIYMTEDGRGTNGYMFSLKELKQAAMETGATLDKNSLVAFCKK